MLRASRLFTAPNAGKFRYHIKYPTVVSYNKMPWRVLTAGTPQVHETACPHYVQILNLARSVNVPMLVNDFHPAIPEEKHLRLLPGSVYILPSVYSSFLKDPGEYGPYGWTSKVLDDELSLQHYGPVAAAVGASVVEVRVFEAPNLRMFCHAITFSGVTLPVAEHSSLGMIQESSNKDDGSAASSDFTMFHFFRPNRAPSEMSRQFDRFYTHNPCAPEVEKCINPGHNWTPRLDPPKRGVVKAKPMKKFVPPQCYVMGLAERLAMSPGNCFGSRDLMWGTWF